MKLTDATAREMCIRLSSHHADLAREAKSRILVAYLLKLRNMLAEEAKSPTRAVTRRPIEILKVLS